MKEDYLWDKTGQDSEVEGLESTLAVFRYKPDAPPPLPAVDMGNSKRRSWQLRFILIPAFSAIVVTAIWMGSLWRGTSTDNVAQIAGAPNVEQTVAKPVTTVSDPKSAPQITSQGNTLPQSSGRVSMIRSRQAIRRDRKHIEPALTAEEKYAYDRLMLALSITGSKLRLVQDKVNGTEVEKTETKNNK